MHTNTHQKKKKIKVSKTIRTEDLLSPKVNVEPLLQNLVGHQRDSELGRGTAHSS